MKKIMRFSKVKSFILVVTLTVQSIEPANANLAQLQNYFNSLKRGVECMVKRKPCAPEDRDAVWTAGKILTLLGVIIVGGVVYKKREKIAGWLDKKLKKKEQEEQEEQLQPFKQEMPPSKPYIEKRNYQPAKKELEQIIAKKLAKQLYHANTYEEINALLDQGASLENLPREWRRGGGQGKINEFKSTGTPRDADIAKRLAQKKPLNMDYDEQLKLYYTIKDNKLITAVALNQPNYYTKALKEGANANVRIKLPNEAPQSLLYYALNKKNKWVAARQLINFGADPDMRISNDDQRTIREAFPDEIKKLKKEIAQKK